jgi:hypothetical protein
MDGFGEKPEQTGHQFYGIKYQIYNALSCVPYVVRFSGLYIFDCPFDIL